MLGRKLDSWQDEHGLLDASPPADDEPLQRAILLSMAQGQPPARAAVESSTGGYPHVCTNPTNDGPWLV